MRLAAAEEGTASSAQSTQERLQLRLERLLSDHNLLLQLRDANPKFLHATQEILAASRVDGCTSGLQATDLRENLRAGVRSQRWVVQLRIERLQTAFDPPQRPPPVTHPPP